MSKKAQGLSLNVIIIAALALLVLVILSVVFMTQSTIFSRETRSCTQQGGICVPQGSDCPAGMSARTIGTMRCLYSDGSPNPNEVCCLPGERIE